MLNRLEHWVKMKIIDEKEFDIKKDFITTKEYKLSLDFIRNYSDCFSNKNWRWISRYCFSEQITENGT